MKILSCGFLMLLMSACTLFWKRKEVLVSGSSCSRKIEQGFSKNISLRLSYRKCVLERSCLSSKISVHKFFFCYHLYFAGYWLPMLPLKGGDSKTTNLEHNCHSCIDLVFLPPTSLGRSIRPCPTYFCPRIPRDCASSAFLRVWCG